MGEVGRTGTLGGKLVPALGGVPMAAAAGLTQWLVVAAEVWGASRTASPFSPLSLFFSLCFFFRLYFHSSFLFLSRRSSWSLSRVGSPPPPGGVAC